jgi:hypothetical protein
LRRLRIVAPTQLGLNLPVELGDAVPAELWPSMPEAAQAQVLALLARLIARAVVDEDNEQEN